MITPSITVKQTINWRSLSNWTMAAAVMLTLSLTSARAGTITVVNLPATGTDAASDIGTNKQYVCAFNYGNNNVGTITNNYVPFTHFGWPGAQNNTFSITNAVDANFGGHLVLTTGGPAANKLADTSSGTQGNLAAQADGNMRTLLTDIIYQGGVGAAGAWIQHEFDNLTPGNSYSLRLYYRYWGNAVGDRVQDATFNGEGASQHYTFDIDAGGAHYIKYDFVALTTNVLCRLTNLVAGGASMLMAATLEYDTNTYAPFIVSGHDASGAWLGSGAAQFSALALGTPSLAYQWYVNTASNYSGATMITDDNDYSGSTTPTLTATNNPLDYYFVIVTNDYGSVTSSIVQINPLPVIITQPTSTNIGDAYVAFTNMTATGFPPLAYQWYYNTDSNYDGAIMATNGSGYSGSATSSLQATTNLQDFYFVVVTNSYGYATSSITAYYPYPVVVKQPTPSIVGTTAGFNVAVSGWPTLGYQWYFNTTSNYDGASILTDGGSVSGSTTTNATVASVPEYYYYYFVVASNYYGSVTSSIALAISPLTALAAGEPIWNQAGQTNVIITFLNALDPVTAATVGNYSLDNGATISSATVVASNEVSLTTSPLTGPYTLTVANVKDFLGGTMSPSSTNIGVGAYPANIALWVRADTGVTTDGTTNVSTWNDLSGNNNTLYTVSAAAPILATNTFGDPVIRFTSNPTNEMDAFDSQTLAITNDISIVAVMNFVALGAANGEIVSKTGSGAGHNNIPAPYDYNVGSAPGLVRGNGTDYGTASGTNAPAIGKPQILAVSESGNIVSHFLNGNPTGTGVLSRNFVEANCSNALQVLTIGKRADGSVRLHGDMSELIVAGSAISSYDVGQLDNYLIARHNISFVNTSRTNLVISASGNQLTFSWPADHIGWELQSNSVGLTATGSWFTVSGSIATNQITLPEDMTKTNVFYRMVYP